MELKKKEIRGIGDDRSVTKSAQTDKNDARIPAQPILGSAGDVFFVTNRRYRPNEKHIQLVFGDELAEESTCGALRTAGTSLSIVERSVSQSDCHERLLRFLEKHEKTIFFVHGYRNYFDTAGKSTISLGKLVPEAGIVLMSWPSRGERLAYAKDKEAVLLSRDVFSHLMGQQLRRTEKKTLVDVLSHSMGGFLTHEVLRSLASSGAVSNMSKFNNLVFAAPDIPVDMFQKAVSVWREISNRSVLYATEFDYALATSSDLQGFPRAGQGGYNALFVHADLETIDVGFADDPYYKRAYQARSVLLDAFSNHLYIFEDERVRRDLAKVLGENKDAVGRGLPALFKNGLRYFRIE